MPTKLNQEAVLLAGLETVKTKETNEIKMSDFMCLMDSESKDLVPVSRS